MLFACNQKLALSRRDILHNLEQNDFENIQEISEKIRFHPTMVTDRGESILVWLIQNSEHLDLDEVKLFIGHVTWDQEAVYQAALAKGRNHIITELNNFKNNCNDTID